MPQPKFFQQSMLAPMVSSFSGSLLLPGDDGYETVRRVHNGMIDRHPALIARCLGNADVKDSLAFAIDQNLEIAVCGGGHNVAGRAVCDDGIMIDLGLMKGTWVDPVQKRMRVQAGVTWGEFNRASQLHGLATTGGAVSSTGVAGLTLGGGFGFLMGKYGYTIDNLKSVEMVSAQGEILLASSEENPELFWGLRGGGGNFGIVTSFEFALHEVGPIIQGGMIAHPFSAARDMLNFYREATADMPDEFTLLGGLTHARDDSGTPLAAMLACHCGSPEDAAIAVENIKSFGKPVVDHIGSMRYTDLNQLLDPGVPKLELYYWKACFVSSLTDDLFDVLIEQFDQCPSNSSKIFIENFHGAATRLDSSATAFPHRQKGYSILIISQWQDPQYNEQNIEWTRQTYDSLQPFSREGAYSNYMDDDESDQRVKSAFGDNFPRLQKLKNQYDPTNLFHRNQNIPPSI